jgi:predicted nucleic acid-binding protein
MTHVLDTNIIIQHLAGQLAADLPEGECVVSVITELELLSWSRIDAATEAGIRSCLETLAVIEINAAIKDATVRVRRAEAIPPPDAIIAGTAAALNAVLITNDSRLQNLKSVRATGLPMLNGQSHQD